jgi:ribosomal protein L19
LEKIEVVKTGKVRRAKIFYIRDIVGVVKIKERRKKRK